MRAMNAKVRTDNTGKHGARPGMNDNGERWTDLCQVNELLIGGTLFPHKECHKRTWMSPDGGTENRIDRMVWHLARDGGARCRMFVSDVGQTLG